MEKKEMYVAPEVEILEVAVEKGFQASQEGEGGSMGGFEDGGGEVWG